MRYITFSEPERTSYEICFLVPDLSSKDMIRHYLDPHLRGQEDQILAYSLEKMEKKTPSQMQKDYLAQLLPVLRQLQVQYLMVCDADYFRTLTKNSSPESSMGYVIEGQGDYAGFNIIYCPNFRTVFYNPDKVKKQITHAMHGLKTHRAGTYIEPGCDIITFEEYPRTLQEISDWLDRLIEMDCDLTCDIETFSLKHYSSGIGTISFAWSKHEGIAFPVDYVPHPEGCVEGLYGFEWTSQPIRELLRKFFQRFRRKMIWHNISFDAYVLIYQLFMKDILDTRGLLKGLEVFFHAPGGWEDTQHIAYLATNSCAGNTRKLKELSQEFAGKYAMEDIHNIRKIPLPKLLRYNLIDTLATWFVHEKFYDRMVADQQLPIYETLLKPSTIDIVQMQLTGMPMDMEEVHRLKDKLEAYSLQAKDKVQSNAWTQAFIHQMNLDWVQERNTTLKKKRVTLADAKEVFNPNSNPQLQRILYDAQFMGLPVLDLTDSKLPATGGDTLKKLLNHTQNQDTIEFLDALIQVKSVEILINNFLPRFLEACPGPDGWHYLFGNFNIGGTVSGRLSSSNPNLQNLPSKDDDDAEVFWAKEIKKCFKAPPGKLFIGLDFNSLEDMISALTTRDPNKIKVYTDGFDGHSLRAHSYFGDQMPDIDPSSVQSINSIKKLYPGFRQESKTPTFLLTYGGTWMGIMNQMGWTKEKARAVEERYHELYRVADAWVADRIREASQTGYVVCAFGLRVRTPLLKQVVRGTNRTPHEAEAEARTAGNALGQSWCLLNNRASVEFMRKVRSSEYALDIQPCAHIHDAQYYMIPDDLAVLLYVNTHLVEAVKWQEDPLIAHDTVKLGGELSVFYPDWSAEMTLPNGATLEQINELARAHLKKYCGG
jgi:DNA polymerase I